jgi:hypothetical protein
MTIYTVGTVAIFFAMAVGFFQKSDVQTRTASVPKLTLAASIILLAVGVVDVYLWLLDLGTFTSKIQSFVHPSIGFLIMVIIFIQYWRKRGTVEALDVMFGMLMGHFWWSWC